MNLKRPQSGQSLVELMVAMSLGTIVSLGMASIFAFGVQQFNALIDQNKAEQSLIQAAYTMRAWLSQAVKINCLNGNLGAGLAPIGTTQNLVADNSPPMLATRGFLDCEPGPGPMTGTRWVTPPGVLLPAGHTWTADVKNPFAVFVKEDGGSARAQNGNADYSAYSGVGIFFTPPGTGAILGMSGVLEFATLINGNQLDTSVNFAFDHMVDVGVVQNTALEVPIPDNVGLNPYANIRNLESVQIRIVARYINDPFLTVSYAPVTGPIAPGNEIGGVDIEMIVPVAFRNSFLGISATGTGTPERVFGGIYFFRFNAPPMSTFDF